LYGNKKTLSGQSIQYAFKLVYRKWKTSYIFTYKPSSSTAGEILASLVAAPYSRNTTVFKLDLTGSNPRKLSDILDAIVDEYSKQSLEDKDVVYKNTISFINQRLDYVTRELGMVETDLKDFKVSNKLVDVGQQSTQAFSSKSTLEAELVQFGIKEELFNGLYQKVRKMYPNQYQLIPVNIGTEGGLKSEAIDEYNKLILKNKKEEPMLGANSPVLADLNAQVQMAYTAVLQSFTEYDHSLQVQKNALNARTRRFDGMVSDAPGKEKHL